LPSEMKEEKIILQKHGMRRGNESGATTTTKN
jgi:hypothetical protein